MISKERAEEIAKQNYSMVYGFCLSFSKGNEHDAADLTQDVFCVFYKKLNTLNDDTIDRWLIAVAKKKALEYYRHIKNQEMVIELEDSFTSAEDVLSTIGRFHSVSDVDIKLTIEAIAKMLTKDEYELFVKKFIEGKKQAQIAEEMGISVSNVSSKTARLRKKIEMLGYFCFTFAGQIIIKNLF